MEVKEGLIAASLSPFLDCSAEISPSSSNAEDESTSEENKDQRYIEA